MLQPDQKLVSLLSPRTHEEYIENHLKTETYFRKGP